MLNKFIYPLIIAIFVLLNCGAILTCNERITGYNLAKPDKIFILPDTLREVSGLTDIDSVTVACVQDENGILFIYDLIKNKIKQQYQFNIDGDYEGITKVDESMYILRSDGVIFEISNYVSKKFRLIKYTTGIPASNNEGLCYDKKNSRLLIACKGKVGKGKELKDKRQIYGFDLTTKKLSNEPTFDFDLQNIKEFALKNKLNIPTKSRKKKDESIEEPFIKFNTSAIAIHPLTQKLFLLSASDHLLFIFSMTGEIEQIELLNSTIFNKAEGITFDNIGNMLITNEGQDKRPTLLYFKYKIN